MSLHNTAHEQYPWMRYADLLSPVAIEGRITTSSAKVPKHKDIINDVANRYNVPSELIGGIIFKEQLTKSLPDALANVDTFIRNDKNHSTGLGAIFPATAGAAWVEVDSQKELPETDEELQYKLTHDKKFNIETIAAVLLYEAKKKELISDPSEASNLTTDQWWEATAEYARNIVEKDSGKEFNVGSVYMILDSDLKGEVEVILKEKNQKKPLLVYVKFDTRNNKLLSFKYVNWHSKLDPGIIYFQDWKIDYAEAIEISEKFFSQTDGFRYDRVLIFSCNSFPSKDEDWEDWFVDIFDEQGNKKYYTRIDPYTGEILRHGIYKY